MTSDMRMYDSGTRVWKYLATAHLHMHTLQIGLRFLKGGLKAAPV